MKTLEDKMQLIVAILDKHEIRDHKVVDALWEAFKAGEEFGRNHETTS
jgi:hypothetical protein